jgi:chromosome segregation ATPase
MVFWPLSGFWLVFIFLTMNDHLKSIDEHLKSLDDKFQAVVELKDLLKNAPDLNQDIKVIGQETKGTHDDVVRLQERMELLEHFPEKILIQLENIQKQLRTTPGVKP